jgi:hypothetical protein
MRRDASKISLRVSHRPCPTDMPWDPNGPNHRRHCGAWEQNLAVERTHGFCVYSVSMFWTNRTHFCLSIVHPRVRT